MPSKSLLCQENQLQSVGCFNVKTEAIIGMPDSK